MRLGTLRVHDLRNLADVQLALGPRSTVVFGENGQGKTNLLEALYLLATLKPLRATRLAELVRFGELRGRVEGDFTLGGAQRQIAVEVEKTSRSAFIDGKPAPSLEDYFGGVSVVAFVPDELSLVREGPEARRKYLDRAVFNRFPAYLAESRAYARALRGRNRLLREHASPLLVGAFDGPLSTSGARLWSRRRSLLSEMGPRVVRSFQEITSIADSKDALSLSIAYRAAGLESLGKRTEPELTAELSEALSSRMERDLDRGFTSVGPHADDLVLHIDDHLARTYASQGQRRAIVLALKLAEIDNLTVCLGRPPLLLLDDVSSELDPGKNALLMASLRAREGQSLLTTTDPRLVAAAAGGDAAYFRIQRGVLQASDPP